MIEPLEIEAAVTLVVPRRERVPATVKDAGPGWVDLLLHCAPATPPSQLRRGSLFVEFVNEQGLCRLHAAKEQDAAPEPPGGYGVNDVMRLMHRGAVQLLQARASIRAEIRAEVLLRDTETGSAQTVATVDLSGRGAQLSGVAGVQEGDILDFEIELPGSEPPLMGRLRVLRCATAHTDVEFTAFVEGDRARLTRFVADAQAAAREARRAA